MPVHYPTFPVEVRFEYRPKGLDSEEGVQSLSATVERPGPAIRWIRRRMRATLSCLPYTERETCSHWLDDDIQTFIAAARIGRGEVFEFVSGHEGPCIKATAKLKTRG